MDGYPDATDRLEHRDLYRYANQYFHEDYKPINGGILNPMDNVLPPDYELFNGNIVRHYQATIADDFRTAGLVGEYDQLNRLRYGTHAFYGTPPTRDRSLASALEAPTFDGNGNIHTMDRHYTTTDGAAQHNRLNYGYKGGTNLLTSVQATVTGPTSDWQPFDLLRGQHTYAYDASGNLTTETNDAGATTITWNPYGKVDRVATPDGLTSFGYGPDQNRWAKSLERDGETRTTYYVRDAPRFLGKGPQKKATLATYDKEGGAAGATLTWKQQYLYGSARLGEVTMDRLMGGPGTPTDFGTRRYELSNHLGNATTVFEEYTSSYQEGSGQGEFTAPVLTSFREYLPFGLGLERGPGGGSGYRFGFNGKELDDNQEWGQGTTNYDYGFRIYNPAIARFLSVDPLSPDYPWYTPYQFAGNTPIQAVDIDGLEPGYSYSPTAIGFGGDFNSGFTTDHQAMANQRARETVDWIFKRSGGQVMYNENYARFMSAGNTSVANGGMATQQLGPTFSTGGTQSTLYLVEDNFSSREAINFMLGNMVTGTGPTNIDYPVNGASSMALLESAIVQSALQDFRKANPDYSKDNRQANGIRPQGYTFGLTDLAVDFVSEWTLFTMEGFVGSGAITIGYSPEDDMVDITITNTTSLTSGDYLKDVPGNYDGESHIRSEGNEQYGNVSQTFRIKITMAEAMEE